MKRLPLSSLRLVLLLIILAAVIPVMGLTLQTGLEHRQMAADAVGTRALEVARHAAHDATDPIVETRQFLLGLATLPSLLQGGAPCNNVLAGLLSQTPTYKAIAVFGTDGSLLCSAPVSFEPQSLTDWDWFNEAIRTRDLGIGQYEFGNDASEVSLHLGYPLTGSDGTIRGVLFVELDTSELAHFPSESQLPPGSILSVMDRNDKILLRYPDPEQGIGQLFPQPSAMKNMLVVQGEGTAEIKDTDGVTRLYAFTPLSSATGNGAYVGIGIPASVAYDEANGILARNLILLGLIAAIALAIAMRGANRWILRPINALISVTQRLAGGDLQTRTDGPSRMGELSQLAHAFDHMAESLERRESESRQTAGALLENERKLRSFVDNSQDGIALADEQGIIIEWNPGQERITGLKRANVIGKPAWEVQLMFAVEERRTPEDCARIKDITLRLVRTPAWPRWGQLHEREFLRADGSRRIMQTLVSPIKTDKGIMISSVSRDITESKQAEEALRNSKEFIEAVFDGVSDSICVMDAKDFRIIKANQAFLSTYDLSEDEVIGRKCYEVTHHLVRCCEGPSDTCPASETLKTGRVSMADHVHYDKHGRKVYVEVSTSPLRDKDGEIHQIVHTVHDITERKRSENEVQRHLQRLSALRSIEVAVTSSLDLRGTLNVLVEQVIAQLGIDAADVLLLKPETQRLEYAAGRGFRTDALRHTKLRLGEGHAGKAVLDRSIKRVPNLIQDPGDFASAPLLADEKFMDYYAVPLVAKGQVKGVLEIFCRSSVEPDSEWLDFLDLLAGQAAIAIDNATLFEDAQRSNLELSAAYDATLEGWVRALDLRHKETEGHTQRVTEMALVLAHRFGISETEMADLRRGALLHDIGKLGIPDRILLKPGPLTTEEWAIMRRHPEYAYQFLSPIEFLHRALDIPYCHHERWDGSGYPRGLKGQQIPLVARLFALVDVWDALRSDRPYRSAWPEDKVEAYIRAQSGKHFDPRAVDAFLKLLQSEFDQPVISSV